MVVYYGVNLCIVNYDRMFNTLKISYSFATASAPVGCFLMSITTIKDIIVVIKKMLGKYVDDDDETQEEVCII